MPAHGDSPLPAGLSLRPASPEDCPALTDLAFRSKASNGYDAAFMEACRAELTVPADEIAAADVWLAEEGGRLVAFFSLWPGEEAGAGEVRMCFVEPALKGRGLGRMLWAKLEACARASDMRLIRLDADPFAVPFYAAMGLGIVGQSPSGSIPGRVLPRMEKVL